MFLSETYSIGANFLLKIMGKDVVGYDITIPLDKYNSWVELGKALEGWCKKFVFQKEKGEETGYMHWQCRVHLIKAKTLATVTREIAPKLHGHWSVTCGKVHENNSFNYVMKEDTKVEGPWTDQDVMEAPKMTDQLKEFLTFVANGQIRSYQQQILERIRNRDFRKIILILDKIGNSGKSIFAEYLEYRGVGLELPPLRAFEDLMQFAFGFKDQKCYIIDMPRALKKDKLSEFYSGLECLKNGVLWDKRYSAKKRRMTRPQIIVFTNTLPCWAFMSVDRWEVWEMQPDYSLSPYQIPVDQ